MMAANRLQRWAIYLSSFDFEINCIPGKENGCADGLSRLCLAGKESAGNEDYDYSYLNFMSENFQKPINYVDVARESVNDPILSRVIGFTRSGWPGSWKGKDEFREYFLRRGELTMEKGVLMWGHRTVIPVKFRNTLLSEIHCSHMGIVKSKALARSYFWWPGLDKCIENMIGVCTVCRENRQNPPRVDVTPWPKSDRPFNRIHIDYCGPLNGENFLIVIDSFSKWLEIARTKHITARRTIDLLKPIFSRFGIPSLLVSDNAASFTSHEFRHFCEANGIKHITSAPYHPASNGQAENSVKTFKTAIKKMLKDKSCLGQSIDGSIETFLHANRNSIHSESGKSPYQLMFNRDPNLRWKSLLPDKVIEEPLITRKTNVKDFRIGENVYSKNFMTGKWEKGEINTILGFNTYMVLINGKKYKKHANHLTPLTSGYGGSNEVQNNSTVISTCNNGNLKMLLKSNMAASSSVSRNATSNGARQMVSMSNDVERHVAPVIGIGGSDRVVVEKSRINKNNNQAVVLVDSHCRKSSRTSKKPDRLDL